MKSIADQLPPDIAALVHPDRRKNEAAYWAGRDQLLAQYQGQWIGFADGKVIASGTSPVTVFHAAEATGLHPFFICVGKEEEPCHVRRFEPPDEVHADPEGVPEISRWLSAAKPPENTPDAFDPAGVAEDDRLTLPGCVDRTRMQWSTTPPGSPRWGMPYRWFRCAQPPANFCDASGVEKQRD